MSNPDDNGLFNLQFTPNWARQSPDAHHERMVRNDRGRDEWEEKRRPRRDDDPDSPRRDHRRDDSRDTPRRDFRRDTGDDSRPPREPFKRDFREPRPPREDARPVIRPPREPREDARPVIRPPREQREDTRPVIRPPREKHEDARPVIRPPREPRREHIEEQPPHPALEPLPVEVRFLPDPKTLGSIMRKVQNTHFAYPLRDMARLFLENLSACLVRVGPLKDQEAVFWVCKQCGIPAYTEEEIRQHFFTRHFAEYFEAVQTETELPTGTFACVAKCGVTGILLGPPNHHSYNTKVQEILRGRCAGMNPETYRSRITMVREPEAIEQWRKESAMRTLYRFKPAEPKAPAEAAPAETTPVENAAEAPVENAPVENAAEAPVENTPVENAPVAEAAPVETAAPAEPAPEQPLVEYAAAEARFLNEILPKKIHRAGHFTCLAEAARHTPSERLNETLREAYYREVKHPSSLFYALRGAFHHRKMHVFRANNAKGTDFVVRTLPVRMDSTDAVSEIRDILAYVAEHPGCLRSELLHIITQNTPDNVNHIIGQLLWLIERGNLIEYYNGVLAIPAAEGEFPHFRYLPGERDGNTRIHGESAEAKVEGEAPPSHAAASAPKEKQGKKGKHKNPQPEAAPAEEPAPVVPTDESAPVEEVAPVEEPAPAESVEPVESTESTTSTESTEPSTEPTEPSAE